MSKKKKRSKSKGGNGSNAAKSAGASRPKNSNVPSKPSLQTETKNSIWAVIFIGLAAIFILAGVAQAGPAGKFLYRIFGSLFGLGYILLPVTLLLMAGTLLLSGRREFVGVKLIGATVFILSALGLIELSDKGGGGILGKALAALQIPFGHTGAVILNVVILIIALLVILDTPLRVPAFLRSSASEDDDEDEVAADDDEKVLTITSPMESASAAAGAAGAAGNGSAAALSEAEAARAAADKLAAAKKEEQLLEVNIAASELDSGKKLKPMPRQKFPDYVPPPLDLLKSTVEKPTTGDLRANANIIKRTLESFGVTVEMGEINIGPKVTRYTLKPAEGVKLSRITALSPDLALALAAHPIRIEAPIPGKSLVGIEVPNKQAAMVRLGSLIAYPDFQASGPLGIAMGRDVNGDPVFANIAKMPHLLIAGSTGSGKSIFVHSLLISLLYKNSPAMLKLALVDPKRVELSMYGGLPHLITPVITENKKAMGVFRWAIREMETRYELFSAEGRRDIQSYNAKNPDGQLPYIVIVIDELADLMSTYGREVEGAIIRLAQMARATGIHLVLSTQRPSVEVITGLIKANITNRVALQVASQIDSRTILDTSGAEKLLGGGDLLFISQELSKSKRIQGAYLSEEEINKVVEFIKENNKMLPVGDESLVPLTAEAQNGTTGNAPSDMMGEFEDGNGDDDELYQEAVAVVSSAKKASASLLQRRLKVGYARAARLLDLMEENGIIGPGDGAKPREVYLEQAENTLEG